MDAITIEMQVTVVPAEFDDIRTTSLVGYLDATYADLVARLGEPRRYDEAGFKIDAEWLLKDASGRLGALTVYNYKNGRNYNGAHAAPVEQITDWNVGGRGGASVALATGLFGERFTAA